MEQVLRLQREQAEAKAAKAAKAEAIRKEAYDDLCQHGRDEMKEIKIPEGILCSSSLLQFIY